MRWLVGIDLRGLSGGALAFAKRVGAAPGEDLYAVHVIEEPPDFVADGFESDTMQRAAHHALAEVVEREQFVDVGVVAATLAEDGLDRALEHTHADVLVIGRRAKREGPALVRLGRVARRMLRQLPRPVVVVPPDVSRIGDGPVLLGTDLSPASTGAAEFARRISSVLGLDLLVTHVAPEPRVHGYFGVPATDELKQRSHERSRERFESWRATHQLGDARNSLVAGDPEETLLEVAKVSGASMIVVGSRGLDIAKRMFVSSLSSHLAAVAPLPVAVVPSELAPQGS